MDWKLLASSTYSTLSTKKNPSPWNDKGGAFTTYKNLYKSHDFTGTTVLQRIIRNFGYPPCLLSFRVPSVWYFLAVIYFTSCQVPWTVVCSFNVLEWVLLWRVPGGPIHLEDRWASWTIWGVLSVFHPMWYNSGSQSAELDLPGQAQSSESTPTKFISMTPTSVRSSMWELVSAEAINGAALYVPSLYHEQSVHEWPSCKMRMFGQYDNPTFNMLDHEKCRMCCEPWNLSKHSVRRLQPLLIQTVVNNLWPIRRVSSW